ncbi:MAG: hypothetical protein N4A44_04620 [Alphaproteobacteria bacterium]|nr:hypothetical protein [Alphaproteobacteria bacterium]
MISYILGIIFLGIGMLNLFVPNSLIIDNFLPMIVGLLFLIFGVLRDIEVKIEKKFNEEKIGSKK